MRLFVAVNLPAVVRDDLFAAAAELRAAAPAVRWVDPDAIHLTLKFLGSVDDPAVDRVREALLRAASSAEPFTLTLSGAGAFPGLRRPRVFWSGVAPSQPLHRLRDAVEREIAPLGFPTEARPFHPHLTLGRVKGPLSSTELASAERAATVWTYHTNVHVETVELMESKLSPRGARYQAITSVPLGVDVGD